MDHCDRIGSLPIFHGGPKTDRAGGGYGTLIQTMTQAPHDSQNSNPSRRFEDCFDRYISFNAEAARFGGVLGPRFVEDLQTGGFCWLRTR